MQSGISQLHEAAVSCVNTDANNSLKTLDSMLEGTDWEINVPFQHKNGQYRGQDNVLRI